MASAAHDTTLEQLRVNPLVAGDNAIVLDDGLSPMRAASVARSAAKAATRLEIRLSQQLATDHFLSENQLMSMLELVRGEASSKLNNCMLNSAAQALDLLEPSRAFDADVDSAIDLWRCHLHARLMPRHAAIGHEHWFMGKMSEPVERRKSQEACMRIFWKRRFQGRPHLHALATHFDVPVVVWLQRAGCTPCSLLLLPRNTGRERTVRTGSGRRPSVDYQQGGSDTAFEATAIWLRLEHGHFEPLLQRWRLAPERSALRWNAMQRASMLARIDFALPQPAPTWLPLVEGTPWLVRSNQSKSRMWELLKIGWRLSDRHGFVLWEECLNTLMPMVLTYM